MKNMIPTEEQEQRAFVEWLTLNGYEFTALGQSTPAGSMRGGKWSPNYKTLARNKAMGIRKGFPDMCIYTPGSAVIFVELKRKNGVPSDVSPEQRKWIDALRDSGVTAIVCCGALEAIKAIPACHYGEKWVASICSTDNDFGTWN